MLTLLRVRNIAIIDELEIELGPGLTVITGETGAGKSILVGALQLVLGGRARPDAVRTGADRAEVEALFDPATLDPAVRARIASLGASPDEELVVRRVVEAGGRSRASVAGVLLPLHQLQPLAAGLVDISSQHEHQTLADPASHLRFLDAFGALDPARGEIARVYEALRAARAALDATRASARDAAEREELLRFQINELERVNPRVGEDEELHAEAARLRHAESLGATLRRAEGALYAEDGAVVAVLARVCQDLVAAARVDPAYEAFLAPVESARAELAEAGRAIGRAARGVRADPERLAEIDERLHLLKRLARRHGSLEAAVARRDAARAELAALGGVGDRVLDLEAAIEDLRGSATRLARALSEARREAAARLGDAITAELGSLGMGSAVVQVSVAPLEAGGEALDGARLSATGVDRVEFLIATNAGEEPRALGRVASGGELSRALLALKRVLAGYQDAGTYVFDEVDTGVGGAVAQTIGRKLADVARHQQVVCITHLPQVAAFGDRHLHVRKEVRDGRTRTRVERLEGATRIEELARMLGGATVTDAARAAAADLVRAAAERA